MKRGYSGLLVVVALAAWGSPARAQGQPAFGVGRWEVTAYGGLIDDRPDFTTGRADFRLIHEGLFGSQIAYRVDSRFSVQAGVFYSPIEARYTVAGERTRANLRAVFFSVGAGYAYPVSSRLQLYGSAGAGGVSWNAETGGEVDFAFDGGGGARYFLTPALALVADLRMHLMPSALATTRRELIPGVSAAGEVLWLPRIALGLSVFFGG